ncbi:pyrimidine dimer DNA glycosylase [Candidatus Woesearchaeota archaeon]|nr:pyrimidine dimer DNA glycosylase [Candidatus Woesearchaeota archaeon]
MRIWDIAPSKLCRNHLLGEHRELHAVWNIITKNKKGYSNHPETIRWGGKLKALYKRHQLLVEEMEWRGYKHKSDLDIKLATGNKEQSRYVNSPEEQLRILRKKGCGCNF